MNSVMECMQDAVPCMLLTVLIEETGLRVLRVNFCFCFVLFEFIKRVVKVTNDFLPLGGNGTLSWSPTRSLAPPVSLMDL